MCQNETSQQEQASYCPETKVLSTESSGMLTVFGDEGLSSIDINHIINTGIMFVEREDNSLVMTTLFHHDGTVTITLYDESALAFIQFNERVRSIQRPDGTLIMNPVFQPSPKLQGQFELEHILVPKQATTQAIGVGI